MLASWCSTMASPTYTGKKNGSINIVDQGDEGGDVIQTLIVDFRGRAARASDDCNNQIAAVFRRMDGNPPIGPRGK